MGGIWGKRWQRQGRREGATLLPGVGWEDDPYAAAAGADAVVLLTEWNEFRGLDLARLAGVMATPRMADLRNIYSPEAAAAAGFAYAGVGRGRAAASGPAMAGRDAAE